MHEPYDEENDEEDNYDDYDQYNYPPDPTKWYYKFDVGQNTPLSQWINDIVNNFMSPLDDKIDKYWGSINSIPGFPYKKFPVNSWISSIGEGNSSLYLGNNYYNEGVWKKKHFLKNELSEAYVKHLQSHAVYFLSQPRYYKGLYEILN